VRGGRLAEPTSVTSGWGVYRKPQRHGGARTGAGYKAAGKRGRSPGRAASSAGGGERRERGRWAKQWRERGNGGRAAGGAQWGAGRDSLRRGRTERVCVRAGATAEGK